MKKLSLILIGFMLLPMLAQAQSDVFTDVYSMHVNTDAIEYLEDNKIVQGYDDGTFKPENRINRAEFTKIIVEARYDDAEIDECIAKNTGSNWSYVYFPDVPKTEWFAKYVCMAKAGGIIDGYPDGTFKPANNINFAEASKIIAESQDVAVDTAGTNNEWFAGYVKGLENKKAIPSSVQFFDKDITRGEMAETIWRLKEGVTDKVTNSYNELTSPFPNIQSCSALKEKFDEYQAYQSPMYRTSTESAFFDAPMTTAVSESADTVKSGGAADDYSSTNIQVSGVDEADIIKNDGEYIYIIKNDTVRIVRAYPPSSIEEVSEITFGDDTFYPNEMFVDDDKLTVIGRSSNYDYYLDYGVKENMIMPPYPYRSSQTKVYIYDISDKSNPEQMRVVRFDGSYSTSRRINDNLYLVMNTHPNVWALGDIESGEELIPRFQDGDSTPEPMTSCADIRYFPGHFNPRYLVVASVPLDDANGEINREVYLGSSENVYSSRTHLYVASSRINYDRYSDWDWGHDRTKTNIYRFSLDDGDIEFKAKGEVPGRILNQFSMDAYKDHFRIATTIGNSWNESNPSTNNVYVLDTDMKTVGTLEDLAPGERIYSTRFMSDRLYMVTFRQVDPLFVIDLKTPTNPKVLGKLKIPGYSDYLHPYDEDHIIGVGIDTDETEKSGVLMQGMKLALFDVSDVANPIQKFTEIIGDRGTYSELLRNHKALLFDKDKDLLAFPIRIQKKITPEELECGKYTYSTCPSLCNKRCIPSECTTNNEGFAECTDDCDGLGSCTDPSYDRYETEFSGAIVYNLNLTDGFTEKGRISHYSAEDILKMGDVFPYNWEKQIQRIVYIGNYLYTISQDMVKSSTMDDAEEVSSITID